MSTMIRKFVTSAAFAVATIASGAVLAVPFQISATTLTGQNGYGEENGNNEGTKLGVLFAVTNPTASFELLNVNQFYDFTFGTVNFTESNGQSGITETERTGNLGVTATFTFAQPGVGLQTINASGTATLGPINDGNPNLVDYVIDWATIAPISFGNGGSFRIDLTDLTFITNGTQNAVARITLLSPGSTTGQPGSVPEPGTLALAGLGLLAAGAARRRKQ